MKKHLSVSFSIAIISLLPVFVYAQFEKQNKEVLTTMDTTALKGKAFLNKASFIRQFIEPLRSKEKNKEGNPILTLSSLHFEALTQMVEKADLNDKPKPKEITDIQTRSRDQITNLSRIAYHTAWTPSREWGWFPTQQSSPVTLQAGQRYYVEALMKEGGGGDNLAVGWQLPNGALERPIPSNRIIPFSSSSGPACNYSFSPTVSNANPSCGGSITFNANCTGPDCSGIGYVWGGNGLYQTTASATTNAPATNGSYTYYLQATKTGCTTQNFNVGINVSNCGGGGSSTCSAENDQCSGNQAEVRQYSVSAASAGSYTLKALYSSHEGAGIIRWQAAVFKRSMSPKQPLTTT